MDLNLLLIQCQKGERKAQQALYDQFGSLWYTICLRYMVNRDDALDVMQNGLIKVYENLKLFDENRGSFKSWSSRIMVNEAIYAHRKRGRKFEETEINDETLMLRHEDETPIERLSAQELMKVIQLLPEGYRIVFNMYAIEGYTHVEIAERLNISVGTSKSQFFKAKKFLRKELELEHYAA